MYSVSEIIELKKQRISNSFEKGKKQVQVNRNGKIYYQLREEGKKEEESEGKKHLKQISSFTTGKQQEFYKWQLDNSKVTPISRSKDLGVKIGRPELKECYKNAAKCCFINEGVNYVEGYAMFMGIPIEHAWCEKDGKYFDPTVDGVLDSSFDEYLAVVELTPDEILEYQRKTGMYGPYLSEVFKDKNNE